MYAGVPDLVNYIINLIKRQPDRSALDVVAYQFLEDVVYSAEHALRHYFVLSLNEPFLQNSYFESPYIKWASTSNDNFQQCTLTIRVLLSVFSSYYGLVDKTMPLWATMVKDHYQCCVINKNVPSLLLSAINLKDWIDEENGLFVRDFLEEPPAAVITSESDITDRSVLRKIQSEGQECVEQMKNLVEGYAEWLRDNCTIQDIVKHRDCIGAQVMRYATIPTRAPGKVINNNCSYQP